MKNRMKKLCMGIVLAASLLGSSLTAMASCDHKFVQVDKKFKDKKVVAYHTHTDKGTGLTYKCTTYNYYYTIMEQCKKCEGTITYEEVEENVHEPGDW